ncbi:hypothetical protein BDN70DRAFT_990714 [Pholiota conissans]|uniref:N-acetyltransferase domain-containing protein n=1 Tax=Pholiota conissans TaxID=109636 RepID=A0A9P5Z7L7_9AGAR|nr:hypothetical protein BDN70DRAFT_990714 [Pholiota conissans]
MQHQRTTDEGAQPLTNPVIRRLRFSHLWKAAKTYEDAFEFDPCILYLQADGKPSPAATRARLLVVLGLWSLKGLFLTINRGSAFIFAYPDVLRRDNAPFERMIDALLSAIANGAKRTKEQRKRKNEVEEKSKVVLDATIRDRMEDMIRVGPLATEPESQGKGYGGALLEVINDFADERSKAMWLLSSNILNEPFYNSHGFETVGTFYVGEGNPEWTKKPIPVQIMVREPKNKSETRTMRRPDTNIKHCDPVFPLYSLF